MIPLSSRALLLALCFLLTAGASRSLAQASDPDHRPIGWFAADVRGAFVDYPEDPGMASFLRVTEENLASRGLGLVVGAHVYPVRLGRYVALGFGGELLFSRGSKTLPLEGNLEQGGVLRAPTVKARLSAISPQFSLNFGGRDGWSYLSGGIGSTKFSSEVVSDTPGSSIATEDVPRASTINYGGGARWFMKKHLAFTLDLRFYAIRPQEAAPTRPSLNRMRIIALNAGVSIR